MRIERIHTLESCFGLAESDVQLAQMAIYVVGIWHIRNRRMGYTLKSCDARL